MNKFIHLNIHLNTHWKDWCWSSNTLATWGEELTHWKRSWCWERLKAGGEGDDKGQDGWMASPTQWTWVWASSGRQWWTEKSGVLQSMGLQRIRQNWVTEQLQSLLKVLIISHLLGWLFKKTNIAKMYTLGGGNVKW